MPKIALIGAGSVVFTRNLCSDILFAPALRESTIALMDIDAGRLERARGMVERLIASRDVPARVEATTDRREAVRGADYVITTFQQGGLEAYALDIEIPPLGIAVRQSSDVFAVSDPTLASALRFIRERACDGATVTVRERPAGTLARWSSLGGVLDGHDALARFAPPPSELTPRSSSPWPFNRLKDPPCPPLTAPPPAR